MGSTVYTDRKATAFRVKDGRIGYALFEKTKDKRSDDKPSWSCMAIGAIEDAMASIFLSAASVESGMLETRGRVSASSYITSWLEMLATPLVFEPSFSYRLEFGGYGATLPKTDWNNADARGPILQSLRDAGFAAEAEALGKDGGYIDASLYEDFDLIKTLYGHTSEKRIHPSYFCKYPFSGSPNPDFGYRPATVKNTSYQPPVFLLAPETSNQQREYCNLLVQQSSGEFISGGWAYSVIGQFLRVAWRDEIKAPGTFKKNLTALRTAIDLAQEVSDDATIHFSATMRSNDANGQQYKWEEDELKQISRGIGLGERTDFQTTWGEVIRCSGVNGNGNIRFITSKSNLAKWIIPKPATVQGSMQSMLDLVTA